jgi:hypothetical protein
VKAQGSGDAGMAGQGQAGQTSQGLFAPGREPNSRSGAVTTVTLAIQVAYKAATGARLAVSSATPGYQSPRALLAAERLLAHADPGRSVRWQGHTVPGLATGRHSYSQVSGTAPEGRQPAAEVTASSTRARGAGR